MELTPVMQRFVLFWGEMGTRWGVNRSVAQIHALLYLLGKPVTADEIQSALGMARSNVSNSLKELQSWNLVQLSHVMGDRRDYFSADDDPWDLVMAVVEERKKREFDPCLEMLREAAEGMAEDTRTPGDVKGRILSLRDFLEDVDGWYAELHRVPRKSLRRLMNLGSKIVALVGG
ncbi:MAG: MarR family transcriptional regulator [Pseudomonadota bacterium]|nr:MarR family transcriptional regulator [Pseudomonadota bacterium]